MKVAMPVDVEGDRSWAQGGMTLIELLVVVAIVALLTAVAIPAFTRYRERGVDSQMVATLNSARAAMEIYYEKNDQSYAGATAAALYDAGYRATAPVTLSIVSDAFAYQLRVCALGGTHASWLYDTNAGTFHGDSGTCS